MNAPPPDAEPPEDEAHRNFVNLLAAIFVIVLAIAAIWLVKTLDERRRIENCVESGRRDCLELVEPAARR
ncbi:MAG TPA: hypothetical protein VEK35_00775 [Roseiarcus sp.]|nr:hypothetical protein [Roseiarcus sp.]